MRRMLAALAVTALGVASIPALAQEAPRTAGQQARPAAPASPTLAQVRQRNQLICGVNGALPGFSAPDPQGVMRGFDADFCRAIAAAVLGDAQRVRFVNMAPPEAGLAALGERRVDLLVRNTTITLTRSAARPVVPGPVIFHDGMGFLVGRALGVTSPRQLGGRTICWSGAADVRGAAADNLAGFAQRHNMQWTLRRFDTPALAVAALQAGQCHAFAADAGALAARRVTEFTTPDDWSVLPEIISGEPLAPWVRAGDEVWRALIFWAANALIQSEYFAVNQQNLAQSLAHPDWRMRRILGVESNLGEPFGLPNTWAARMLQAVGNYGDIFERNLGRGSVIGMDRGLNAQWTQGGLIYGMPLR